jgi:hypothetical protein
MLAESDVQPVGSCASEPAAIGSTATATGDVTTTHRIIEKGVRKLAPDDNMYKMLLCSMPLSIDLHAPCTCSYTSVSARLIISSYTVHANALLIAFLPILKLKPANMLRTPSSRNIIPAA